MSNKWLRIILIGVGAVLVLCILLGAGIFVVRWTSHLPVRSVGLFRQIFALGGAHGAVGTIQTINGQTITLLLNNGITQSIMVNNQTRFEQNRKKISLTDLKVNDRIAVIGTPDSQGEITARWIHILNPLDSESIPVTPTPEFK